MDNSHIGYLIKAINDKLKTKADETLKTHNLTLSQSRIVGLLSEKNGHATQKELEDILGVSHPTIVGLVSRMEQNGMVSTYFDGNSRSKTVTLTPYALSLAKDMDGTITQNEKQMLNGFTDEEAEALRKALNAILKNIDN